MPFRTMYCVKEAAGLLKNENNRVRATCKYNMVLSEWLQSNKQQKGLNINELIKKL
jgi:predicted amidophosphoribosyltransferase